MNLSSSTRKQTSLGFLPYGRQEIDDSDVDAVVDVLKSDWLTQGPMTEAFEKSLAEKLTARHAVACSNGTAALHLIVAGLGIGDADEVLTTPFSFVASSNVLLYQGARPRFADISPTTYNLDPERAAANGYTADKLEKLFLQLA